MPFFLLSLHIAPYNTSSFYELLQKDNSFKIHHRNIQKLALEMYRVKHRIAPKIICELLNEANVPYNLRQDVSFRSYNVKTVLYGTETLSYLGPKIWNLVPSDIRDCATEPIFRQKIKNGYQIDFHVGSAKFTFLI